MAKAIEVTGTRRVRRALGRMKRAARREAMPRALRQEMELVVGEAKEIAPIDKGPLAASGHAQPARIRGGVVSVTGGFGGPAGAGNLGGETNTEEVGYALVQHERLDYRHAPGRQAKYLEQPFFQRAPQIPRRVAEELERTLAEESV
ncbi:MAG: hypothetical protein ACODAE_05230 [Gemmatimonadota bacterium]